MDWRDLARTQAGAISREQLRECGLSEDTVRLLVRRRDLIHLAPGVYAHRAVPDSFLRRVQAAVLWSGGQVSHRSAAALWNLPVDGSPSIHLTVPRPFQGNVAGIRLHRVPLVASETTAFDGVPVTTRTRTVIDLLRTERYGAARGLLDRSVQQRWVDVDTVIQSVRDGLGRTGNVQLRRLIAELEPGAQAESERVLHRLLRQAGITGWQPQYRIQLTRSYADADLAFPEQRLIIEVDGRLYHDEFADRFEVDRTRQNELMARGWRVLRFTWRALRDDPDAVIASIRTLLAPIRQPFAR